MNKISNITKQEIYEIFFRGIDKELLFGMENVKYDYFGKLKEIDFLKRIYDLEAMESLDQRYDNAEDDIRQHTVCNDDYPYCWVFEDERFNLSDGSDEIYLRFICEVFHPEVRVEKGNWKEFLEAINKLLNNDGYEIYPIDRISNRDIYGWRTVLEDSRVFVPYSQRNKKEIEERRIHISRDARRQIYKVLELYNVEYRAIDDTGWNYNTSISQEVFKDIDIFYDCKYYNENQEYMKTDSLEKFVYGTLPENVLDVIELFQKHISNIDFETDINKILKLNNLDIKLENGKIESLFNIKVKDSDLSLVQEAGLKELIQDAENYYIRGNYEVAVEKIWDALERLKTYYSPSLNKKNSIKKIIDDMSNDIQPYKDLFEEEFNTLTKIGNEFRIRHHETTKINIEDNRYYDYFYKRCLSLISVSILYLDNRGIN